MKKTDVRLIRKIGKGKSGVSWLAETASGPAVFKEMHDEKVPYYRFERDKTVLELEAYGRLSGTRIRIPALLDYSIEDGFIVKEYINGPTVAELTAAGGPPAAAFAEILSWSRHLRQAGINIDYFPANFVLGREGLYYVDYEFNPYLEEWDFENWGIYYWLNSEGMREFLETGNHDSINIPGTGRPVRTEVLETRKKRVLERSDTRDVTGL